MQGYHALAPDEAQNVFRLIGKDWMLITAAGKAEDGTDTVNTMTASWGGMGVLWNLPVAFCFIRPQRYTYTLTEQSERFSLSFLGEEYRAALQLCGKESGRDIDKFAAAGLTPQFEDDTPFIGEARLVLLCRKLYADDLNAAKFVDESLLANYREQDYHRMYICAIEAIYEKDEGK